MSYSFPPALARLIREQMASGNYASEDDLLLDAMRALTEQEEDLRAVQEAISAWRAGDEGVPLGEAFAAIRKRVESGRGE